jgi:hypothetical protein
VDNKQMSNSGEMYGSVPDVDPMTAGRGTETIVPGIVQRKSYGQDEHTNYPTGTAAPTYDPGEPGRP